MQLRLTLAALASASAVLLAGCAGDDLATDSADSPAEGAGDKGSVDIAGQSFPEAALVAAMYDQLLTEAGYSTEVTLVDARDAYMADFPGNVDVVRHLQTGVVYRTAADAVAWLARLAGDDALRGALGRRAGREARLRFGEERLFGELAPLYAARAAR